MAVIINISTPNKCGDCLFCIFTADEKRYIGYCNTSDDDYYCKVLDCFMEYDKVDGGVDILGKPSDCPLKSTDEMIKEIEQIVDEEKINDPKWALGLKYSLRIIHKYCDIKSEDNE